MDEVRWKFRKTELTGSWQIINDGYLYFSVSHRKISGVDREKYLPAFLNENGLSGKFGINYGF